VAHYKIRAGETEKCGLRCRIAVGKDKLADERLKRLRQEKRRGRLGQALNWTVMMWARMHGKGRLFFRAMGDRPENWKNEFFLNSLAGGIGWSIRDATAQVDVNLKQAAPGYAEILLKFPEKK
jgi:type 1 glutamine amidotransferase